MTTKDNSKVNQNAESIKQETSNDSNPNNNWKENFHSHHHHEGGISWALFLLTVGIVLLLNNFGILSWNVWSILWRFWPIFLIIIALQMILGRSWISRIIIFIISLFMIGSVLFYSVASVNNSAAKYAKKNFPRININKIFDQR